MEEEELKKLGYDFINLRESLDNITEEIENYLKEYKHLGTFGIENWELYQLIVVFEHLISLRNSLKPAIQKLNDLHGTSNLRLMVVDAEIRRRKENRPSKELDYEDDKPFSFDDDFEQNTNDEHETDESNLPF